MNEVIEIRTEYSAQDYMKFNKFHVFRKSWYIVPVPVVIFIILGISLIISGDMGGTIFVGVGVLFPLFLLFIMNLTAKRHLKTNKIYESMKNIYFRFDENIIYNETVADDLKTTLETKWDKVYRVYESMDSFYLYISNMQAFIVPKKDIISGTADSLKQLLYKKSEEKKFKVKLL